MTRSQDLLQKAAQAFEEGMDPFSHSWLSENEVTAQECWELGQSIAGILKGYLASPQLLQAQLAVCGAAETMGHGTIARAWVEQTDAMQKIINMKYHPRVE